MKTRKYGNEVLQMVKKGLPELYNQQIKGRRTEFVNKYKLILIGKACSCSGKKVGCVTKDLQLLYALGSMFDQLGRSSFSFNKKAIRCASEACQVINDRVLSCLSSVCYVMFWSVIKSSFCSSQHDKKQFFLCIQPDLSIVSERYTDIPANLLELESEKYAKKTVYDALLYIIEQQMEFSRLALYMKSHIRKTLK